MNARPITVQLGGLGWGESDPVGYTGFNFATAGTGTKTTTTSSTKTSSTNAYSNIQAPVEMTEDEPAANQPASSSPAWYQTFDWGGLTKSIFGTVGSVINAANSGQGQPGNVNAYLPQNQQPPAQTVVVKAGMPSWVWIVGGLALVGLLGGGFFFLRSRR